ncbi:MAG: GNAT family N-acetyltransferase [Thermomicrobiales bacterium]|nr:GNAT family N-acetyltransferase [Thermomicrobiales bacterium]
MSEAISPEPYGIMYSWWRGDPLPDLLTLTDLRIDPAHDQGLVEHVTGIDRDEIARRFDLGHRPWIAWLSGEPVGWGWLATRDAFIGGLDVAIVLPDGDRYLWDFVTRPGQRGRRIYPTLLQAMIRRDRDARRCWIGHDIANTASRRGILRAGFGEVGAVHATPSGGLVYVARGPLDRARRGAELLGLPMADLPASYA